MLQSIIIQNYILIESLQLQLSDDLTTITGETGAGKSILLDALGLLLGNRADSKIILDSTKKCVIEGVFTIDDFQLNDFFETHDLDYDTTCVIRREINTNGKSRGFINDTPVTIEVLKQLGEFLIDIHSQNDTLLVGNPTYQLRMIDKLGGWLSLTDEVSVQFKSLQKQKAELKSKEEILTQKIQQQEFNQYLLNELEEVKPVSGEDVELENKISALTHAEDSTSRLGQSSEELDGSVIPALISIRKLLQPVADRNQSLLSVMERLSSVIEEIKDIQSEIENKGTSEDINPDQLEKYQERLSLLYGLQKKHKVTDVESLLIIAQQLQTNVESMHLLEEDVNALKLNITQLEQQLYKKAEELSGKRRQLVPTLEKEIKAILKELSMPDAIFQFSLTDDSLGSLGIDKIQILFSANKGQKLADLKQVASGGEFSRVVLALKSVLAAKVELPTLVFDEIDTGVSGEVAIKMGKMIKKMAEKHQVIMITHLPQVAAMGNKHWFVHKQTKVDRTLSSIEILTEERRVAEIAKMIGGDKPSALAVANAKEMLTLQ
ncbi:MAG: DNA repair protein RecN [Cytophagaceae bacterium]